MVAAGGNQPWMNFGGSTTFADPNYKKPTTTAPPSANAGLGTGAPGQVFQNGQWQSPAAKPLSPGITYGGATQPMSISNRTDLGGSPGTMINSPGPMPATAAAAIPQPTPAPHGWLDSPASAAGGNTYGVKNGTPYVQFPQNTPTGSAAASAGPSAAGTSFTPQASPAGAPYPTPATGNALAGSVLQQFEQGRQSANQANESRYQDILGKYDQLTGQQSQAISGVPQEFQGIADAYGKRTNDLSQLLKGFGDSQRQDLQSQYAKATSGLQQSMINRGLTNSTAFDSAMRGAGQDYNRNLRGLEDSLTRQQMDYMGKLTGEELQSRTLAPNARMDVARQTFDMGQQPLGFMERKTDAGPSMSDVANFGSAVGTGAAANPNYLSALGDTGQNVGYGASGTSLQTPSAVSGSSPTSPSIQNSYQSPNTSPYQVRSNMGPALASGTLGQGGSIAGNQSGGLFGGGGGGGRGGGKGGGGGGAEGSGETGSTTTGQKFDEQYSGAGGYGSMYSTAVKGGYSRVSDKSEVQTVNPKTGKMQAPAGYLKNGKPFFEGDNPDPSQIDASYQAGPYKPAGQGQTGGTKPDEKVTAEKAGKAAGMEEGLISNAMEWLKDRGVGLANTIGDSILYAMAPTSVQTLIDSYRKSEGK